VYSFIRYEERRRPRRGAPAADQRLKKERVEKHLDPPCLGEALRREVLKKPKVNIKFMPVSSVIPSSF
jgi:hypothetical protein